VTATCTLCGTILSVEPDGVFDSDRQERTFAKLIATFNVHLHHHHMGEEQHVIDSSIMRGSLAFLFKEMIEATPILLIASFLQTDDPYFVERTQKHRECLLKALEPKQLPKLVQVPH
jgi:hypothetical protein